MWIIIIILFAGVVLGYLLSRIKNFNKLTDRISLYVIYVLLLFMGLGVGSKPEIIKNLGTIGADALLIAVFAIAGSILTAFLLYRYIFSGK